MLAPTTPPAAAGLLAALDALAEVDASALTGAEQAGLLRVLGRVEARVCALRLGVIAAAERSGTPAASGSSGVGQWAARITNSDQPAAQRQARLAAALGERPATSRALSQGRLSAEHAAVIVRATNDLPQTLTKAERATVEAALVRQAQELPPQALRRVARRAIAAVERDERKVDAHENQLLADEEAAAWEKTRLSLRDNHDGTLTGCFTVPTLHGHLLRKVLQSMTAPRRARPGASQAHAGSTADRTDWDRARGQAFCELVEHLPTDRLHPKTAATIVVKIDEDQLHQRLKAADLDTGEKVSASQARRLACNAGILPAVLAGRPLVLDLGRLNRLFTPAQRVALGLLHDTCAADGCQRPFAWCELHHRQPWSTGGHTDLTNAIPLCHFHHQRIHDTGYNHRHLPSHRIEFTRRT